MIEIIIRHYTKSTKHLSKYLLILLILFQLRNLSLYIHIKYDSLDWYTFILDRLLNLCLSVEREKKQSIFTDF